MQPRADARGAAPRASAGFRGVSGRGGRRRRPRPARLAAAAAYSATSSSAGTSTQSGPELGAGGASPGRRRPRSRRRLAERRRRAVLLRLEADGELSSSSSAQLVAPLPSPTFTRHATAGALGVLVHVRGQFHDRVFGIAVASARGCRATRGDGCAGSGSDPASSYPCLLFGPDATNRPAGVAKGCGSRDRPRRQRDMSASSLYLVARLQRSNLVNQAVYGTFSSRRRDRRPRRSASAAARRRGARCAR